MSSMMSFGLTGAFLLVLLTAVASMEATDLCPFDGNWTYHNSTGTCMSLQGPAISYFQAIQQCEEFKEGGHRNISGHLVYIFDKETNDFVKDLVTKNPPQWAMIGLNNRVYITVYRWGETQKELGKDDYREWADYQPLNNDKRSVVITETGWKIWDLYETAFFVCQVDAVMPTPTIDCPSSEFGQRSSNFTCVVQFPDSLAPSDLTFQRAGHDVSSCTSQRCQDNEGYESFLEANTTWWSSVLQIKKVLRNHEDKWTCFVKFTNGQNSTSEPCGLQVYTVPPSVTCERTFVEEVMNVSCETERMYPKANCRWHIIRGANSQISPTSLSSFSVQDDYGGENFYRATCTASITGLVAGAYQIRVAVFPSVKGLDGTQPSKAKTGSLNVTVELPPIDQPKLCSSNGARLPAQINVTENQTVSITCRIPGGTPEVYSTILTCPRQPANVTTRNVASSNIVITKDVHGTNCSCYGKHVTGSTNTTILKFQVMSPPKVLSFTINHTENVADVKRDAVVFLLCTATGYPPYELSLLHDQGGKQTLKAVNSSEVSYNFKATCQSMGKYTCLAKMVGQDEKHVNLRVPCGPVFCPATKELPEFGIANGSNKTVKMCVLAYHAPTSYNLFRGTVNNQTEVPKTSYVVNFNYTEETTGRGEIRLTLSSVEQRDLGVYKLYSEFKPNPQVNSFLEFNLTELAAPSCPENLTVSRTFSDSITLSWKPRSNGGAQQSFTILRYDSGSTVESQPIPQPAGSLEDEMSNNVTGLSGSTTYTFGLRARNEGGVTECGLRAQWSTEASPLSSRDQNLTVIVVPVVLVLVLLIIVVVVVVFVVVRRRRSTGQERIQNVNRFQGGAGDSKEDNTYARVIEKNNKKGQEKPQNANHFQGGASEAEQDNTYSQVNKTDKVKVQGKIQNVNRLQGVAGESEQDNTYAQVNKKDNKKGKDKIQKDNRLQGGAGESEQDNTYAQVNKKDNKKSKDKIQKDNRLQGGAGESEQDNTYGQVNKKDTNKGKTQKGSQSDERTEGVLYSNMTGHVAMKAGHGAAAEGTVYSNVAGSSKAGQEKQSPARDDGRTVNQDGLIYAEVTINVKTTNPDIKGQARSKVAMLPSKAKEPGVEYVTIDFAASASSHK